LIPEFAPAWAGWANADVVLTFTGPNRAKALADSEVHARMAVALDDSLGSAYAALGHSSWQRWQWRQAEDAFRRGIELAAGAAVPHQLYGLYLASVGHSSQAIAHASRAVEIEPLSGVINYALAQVYLQSGQFEAAIAQARRTLTIDRHFPLAFHALIRAHALLGRTEEAWQVLADLQRVSNRDLPEWRAYLLARKGDFEGARVELAREAAARAGLPAPMAGIFALAAMGDADGALDALEYAFAHHSPGLVWLGVTPELASLRSAPRFSALLERMHRP
jgi:pentatricopeptide repeat protein